jgi:hypothetical protein
MSRTALLILAFFSAMLGTTLAQYKDYPQHAGKVHEIPADIPPWLSFDAELRGRTEAQTAISYLGGNAQVYELTRIRGGMELRPSSWMKFYVQFHDTHALGLPLKYTASNMRDEFDFRQGYLEAHVKNLQLYTGRKELKFGDERIVGISDWTNSSRTFDGFFARIGEKNRLDLFTASVVVIHPTALDMHAAGLNFHGAYGSINSWIPRTTLEPYVLIKALPRVLSQQKKYGTETEVTTGIRAAANPGMGFDLIAEGALQRGSYSNDSIHAGAAYAKVGYSADHLPWKPRLRGEYDYATGNPHTNPLRIGTFDQQYPSSHNVFGLVDLFGWQNIKETRASLDLAPSSHWTLLIQQEFLRVANTRDSVYSGGGSAAVKPPAGGFLSDNLGHGFDAQMKYVFRDSLVMNAGVGHFSPGSVMTGNQHGAPLTISFLGFTYRFRVQRSAV